jgi:thioredoxin reductase
VFDVIVVGGGPAGLSAALMLGRCRRRVLVCDRGEPRNRYSRALHGYLTRDGIPPSEFNAIGRDELTTYGIECRATKVVSAAPVNTGFEVTLADDRVEGARFILLATGMVDELPPIGGMEACYGRSVFHCPYCDGWEWRDHRLAAVGKTSGAAKLALALTTWSREVLLCP